MSPLFPDDLNGKDATTICKELFGEDPEDNPWWSLEREDERSFTWNDYYLGINWRATHGYLVALNEVSTPQQAAEFASKNRIKLFEDGGLYFKGQGVAELFIRCIGIPPREEIREHGDLYSLRIKSGTVAKIGYGSMLFLRLVAGPTAEINPSIPDPRTLTTLVLYDVERDEVPKFADLALYHFRNYFKGLRFAFWRLTDLNLPSGLAESPENPDPPKFHQDLEDVARPEAISFFNRAKETEAIPGFLYFYRVLETCFDNVIDREVTAWRTDESLDCIKLMKKIRTLQWESEDKWALRKVLGKIVDQPLLDKAKELGLIQHADADSLRNEIYSRRNSIAHGSRWRHINILVPFGFSLGDSGQHDRSWYELMEELAEKALHEWILIKA